MRNYIHTKLADEITVHSQNSALHKARIEWVIFFILSYLWFENIEKIAPDEQLRIKSKLIRPSIGHLVEVLRRLDVDSVFSWIIEILNDYPEIRNEYIGHGYDIPWNTEFIKKSNLIFNQIQNFFKKDVQGVNPLSGDLSIIYVEKVDADSYKWWSIDINGRKNLWQFSRQSRWMFEVNSLYVQYRFSHYYKLSPFIYLENWGDKIFLFSCIEDQITSRVKYMPIYWSEDAKNICVMSLLSNLSVLDESKIKCKSTNNTVRNNYQEDIVWYINIDGSKVKSSLLEFVRNSSSVCAVLWGHGGIWKTTEIQKFCQEIFMSNKKYFDYIIFLSAKDRKYNYYTSEIEEMSSSISSLDDIIAYINRIVYSVDSNDASLFVWDKSLESLIIIDDFETFINEEKTKIIDFIDQKLNSTNHKVIITTRNFDLISSWKQIEISELSHDETIHFLVKVIEKDKGTLNPLTIQLLWLSLEQQKAIYKATNWRPIFILQLANLLLQNPSIISDLKASQILSENALNFLYDRIYNELKYSKDIFLLLGVVLNENSLNASLMLLKKVIWNEDSVFEKGVNELRRLKIIHTNGDILSLYTKEILWFIKKYSHTDDYASLLHKYDILKTANKTGEELLLEAREYYYGNPEKALLSFADISRNKNLDIKMRKIAILSYIKCSIEQMEQSVEKVIWIMDDNLEEYRQDVGLIIYLSRILFDSHKIEYQNKAIKFLKFALETSAKEEYFLILANSFIYSAKMLVAEKQLLKRGLWASSTPTDSLKLGHLKHQMQDCLREEGSELDILLEIDTNTEHLLSEGWELLYFSLLKYLIELNMRTHNHIQAKKYIERWEAGLSNNFQDYFNIQRSYLLV